jgi:RNA polymerase sigma-70 factor (ECF subfamily)
VHPPAADRDEKVRGLITAARSGDDAALGRLLELFREHLQALADAELRPGVQAKVGPSDIVQDTFLEAFKLFTRFQGEKGEEIRAWLGTILRYKLQECYNLYQGTQKRQVERETSIDQSGTLGPLRDALPGSTSTPSGKVLRKEEVESVAAALDRLPESYRQVIVWRNWEDLPFSEIGRRLGRSEDAARMLFGRALERLAEEIEREQKPGTGATG